MFYENQRFDIFEYFDSREQVPLRTFGSRLRCEFDALSKL